MGRNEKGLRNIEVIVGGVVGNRGIAKTTKSVSSYYNVEEKLGIDGI